MQRDEVATIDWSVRFGVAGVYSKFFAIISFDWKIFTSILLLTNGFCRTTPDCFGRKRQEKTRKPLLVTGFWTLLDFFRCILGAEGETRTRTTVGRYPLKIVCLPIPPLRLKQQLLLFFFFYRRRSFIFWLWSSRSIFCFLDRFNFLDCNRGLGLNICHDRIWSLVRWNIR